MADHAYGLPTYTHPEEQRDKEIFASWSPQPRLTGVTIASGEGVMGSGTILAMYSKTDSNVPAAKRGKYGIFRNSAGSGLAGLDSPIGVLRNMVDATSEDRPGEMVSFGILKMDQLISPSTGTLAHATAKTNAENPFRYSVQDSNRNEIRIG